MLKIEPTDFFSCDIKCRSGKKKQKSYERSDVVLCLSVEE